MRHPRRVLDQALDAAERLGELEELRPPDELDGLLLGLGEERDHPAEVAHLPLRDLVAGVRREAGVEHPLDPGLLVEPAPRSRARSRSALHPHGERLDPAQHEPGVERARARRRATSAGSRGARRSSVVRAAEAADDVGVAAEVLGRRVEDDVGAELERLLEVRRGEGVVDDEERADRVRRVGGGADVDDVQQRVRRASRSRRAACPRRAGRRGSRTRRPARSRRGSPSARRSARSCGRRRRRRPRSGRRARPG